MLHFIKHLPAGQGLADAVKRRLPTLTLDWDLRQKSRFAAQDDSGAELAVLLPRGTVLRGGDVLVGEDGSLLRVQAAAQSVLQVRHCTQHGSPFDLLRAAYHLGNRHVPLELQPALLQLEPDPVLAQMLRAQHLLVNEALAPFEPEGGAYGAHAHSHGHSHAHPHEH